MPAGWTRWKAASMGKSGPISPNARPLGTTTWPTWPWTSRGPAKRYAPWKLVRTSAERAGLQPRLPGCRSRASTVLAWVGRLRDALDLADATLPDLQQRGDDINFGEFAYVKALVMLEIDGSSGNVAAQAVDAARRTESAQAIATAQTVAALECRAAGQPEQAEARLRDLLHHTDIEKATGQRSYTMLRAAPSASASSWRESS